MQKTWISFPFSLQNEKSCPFAFPLHRYFFSSIFSKILEDKKSSSDQILQRALENEWDSWFSYGSPF